MIIPPKLKFGDKIGFISTARKICLEELNPAIRIMHSWGLEVVLGKFLFGEDNQFSGTVAQRSMDLQNMIDDDTIKAVFCSRGGYGTIQILDKVNFSNLRKKPKWIIGYSDITVLHSHLNRIGFATLHATMPINFNQNSQECLLSLKNSLFGLENVIESRSHKLNRFGKIKGEIIGGNLSILYSLLGSKSDIDAGGKILFIEDLDEYLYHIDRMLINMYRNGKFRSLKGMIIGSMTDMRDNDVPFGKQADEIIFEYIKEYNFPVCFDFPSGHTYDNRSIKLGVDSILDINVNGVILSQF